MPKPIKSAYEVAIARERVSPDETESRTEGFFVDDSPSKILGSRAKHPAVKNKQEIASEKKTEVKKTETIEKKGLDMNAYISCNVTLSNKLAKIIKNGSTASLFMGPFEGNKASGYLRFETEYSNLEELKEISNTSVMLEVLDSGEDIPEIGNDNPVVSFGTSPLKLVEKIAITNPRKHAANISRQPKGQLVSDAEKKIAIQAALKNNKNSHISSYEELIDECNKIPGINTVAMPSHKPKNGTRFTRAEAMEYEKEIQSLPRLQKSVFIKNNHASRIEIGDISLGQNNLILAPFEVFDLSVLSGRIVRDSSHLRSLLMSKANYLSFVGREEYEQFTNSREESSFTTGYKAFSGERASEMAAEAMYEDSPFDRDDEAESISHRSVSLEDRPVMEISEEELDTPVPFDSDETTNILKTMPKERAAGFSPVSQQVKKPSDGSKSIRRV